MKRIYTEEVISCGACPARICGNDTECARIPKQGQKKWLRWFEDLEVTECIYPECPLPKPKEK